MGLTGSGLTGPPTARPGRRTPPARSQVPTRARPCSSNRFSRSMVNWLLRPHESNWTGRGRAGQDGHLDLPGEPGDGGEPHEVCDGGSTAPGLALPPALQGGRGQVLH
jgi:hypothetical protein